MKTLLFLLSLTPIHVFSSDKPHDELLKKPIIKIELELSLRKGYTQTGHNLMAEEEDKKFCEKLDIDWPQTPQSKLWPLMQVIHYTIDSPHKKPETAFSGIENVSLDNLLEMDSNNLYSRSGFFQRAYTLPDKSVRELIKNDKIINKKDKTIILTLKEDSKQELKNYEDSLKQLDHQKPNNSTPPALQNNLFSLKNIAIFSLVPLSLIGITWWWLTYFKSQQL